MKNPEYTKLSNADKTVLKFSILLHDIGKREGVGDSGGAHSVESAIYANSILDGFSLSQETKERIVNMIRHHHYRAENNSENFGKYFRTSGDATVAKILAQSDYKARFGNELPVNKYRQNFENNPMLVHKNPLAAKKYPKFTRIIDGKSYEVSVLNCSGLSPDTDMSQWGYPKGTKLKDITVQVHNVKYVSYIANILENYLDPNKDITLSTSLKKLISADNGYGAYGVILSTTRMNRGGGIYDAKIDGGTSKGFMEFFNPKGSGARKNPNFAALFKAKITLDDTTLKKLDDTICYYIDRYFATLNYPSQIREQTINNKSFSEEELTEIWYNANEVATSVDTNEIFALNPKVEQIIIHEPITPDKPITPENIPADLIKLSNKYNIPIIIVPQKVKQE